MCFKINNINDVFYNMIIYIIKIYDIGFNLLFKIIVDNRFWSWYYDGIMFNKCNE